MRKETIGICELYLGDCREILPSIAMVDHTITDPPYARDVYLRMRKPDSAGGNRKHKIKKGDALTKMKAGAIGAIDEMIDPVSIELARMTKRWCLVFSDIESCHLWRSGLEQGGLRYIRTGAWVKPNAMPQMTGDRPGVGFEPCTVAHQQGKMRWNGGGYHALWTHNICRIDRPDHPCPKPLSLMKEIIGQFTDPREIILDPFMGSGTTGLACSEMGRKFIGIEIDEKFFDISCRRIEESQKQSDMFIKELAQ